MANERSPIIDYAIIGLLLLNLGVTSYSIFRPSVISTETAKKPSVDISEAEANSLATDVVKMYNAKDDAALFAKLDSLAKAQLSKDQLTAQMQQLYPIMGTISDAAFSSAELAGNDSGRDYYNLNYKVRLTGGPFSTGDMKLTVTRRESGLGLVGFFINGTSRQ